MNFREAFEKFVKGQSILEETSREINYTIAEGIILENNYSYLSYGGGASGEDINTKYIVCPKGEVIAKESF